MPKYMLLLLTKMSQSVIRISWEAVVCCVGRLQWRLKPPSASWMWEHLKYVLLGKSVGFSLIWSKLVGVFIGTGESLFIWELVTCWRGDAGTIWVASGTI